MEPTLDTSCLREIVRQRQARFLHDAGERRRVPEPGAARRTPRHRLATVLHHLAERIEPTRLEARPLPR